jgi:hypothetical protein
MFSLLAVRSSSGSFVACKLCSKTTSLCQPASQNTSEANRKSKYYLENLGYFKDYQREYRLHNKEALKEKNKRYYLNNREAINERKRQYHRENREGIKRRKLKYYSQNREALLTDRKQYYLKNKALISKKQREYYRENAERVKDNQRQYRITHKDELNECSRRHYKLARVLNPRKLYFAFFHFLSAHPSHSVYPAICLFLSIYLFLNSRSWLTPEEVREFFESVRAQLDIQQNSDWYNISQKQLAALGGTFIFFLKITYHERGNALQQIW